MVSVTQRIKQVKQPRGGYVGPRLMHVRQLDDGIALHAAENIHPSLAGLAVDYLSRVVIGADTHEAFRVSLAGAQMIGECGLAASLLDGVTGLDDRSIASACRLAGFDVVFRAGAAGYRPVSTIVPDAATLENIRVMVRRSMSFFNEFGAVVVDGFTFEGGYTTVVDSGDGDFLTADTLWDFKVSVNKPTSAHTLQLLMYYLMGKRSIHEEFQSITSLGIFNPRMNTVHAFSG